MDKDRNHWYTLFHIVAGLSEQEYSRSLKNIRIGGASFFNFKNDLASCVYFYKDSLSAAVTDLD